MKPFFFNPTMALADPNNQNISKQFSIFGKKGILQLNLGFSCRMHVFMFRKADSER